MIQEIVNGNPDPHLTKAYVTQTSTNAQVTMGSINIGKDIQGVIELQAATNDMTYQIDASMDGTVWHAKKAETLLAAAASTYETLSEAWLYFRVLIKSNVGGAHGVMTLNYRGIKQ